jgi:hypothetical protein
MGPEEFAEVWKPTEFQRGWEEVTSLEVTHVQLLPLDGTTHWLRITR